MTVLRKMFPAKMIIFHSTNVCDKQDVERAFATVMETFQKIDCVVACAGVLNEEDYRLTVEVNLVGNVFWFHNIYSYMYCCCCYFSLCRHKTINFDWVFASKMGVIHTNYIAMKYMTKEADHNGGLIVNISSVAGIDCSQFSTPVYNASKHGVVAFTRSMGVSFKNKKQKYQRETIISRVSTIISL